MSYLANTLFRAAQVAPDHASLICGARRFTWVQTLDRVQRTARGLLEAGARAGDRIAVLSAPCAEYVELTYAAAWAGLTLAPINTRLAAAELSILLEEAAPAVILGDATGVAAAAEAGFDHGVVFGGADHASMLAGAALCDPALPDREADWAIIYTGGTTGRPKGVRLSHRAIAHDVNSILVDMNWGRAPIFLQTTPLFHLAGLGPSYAVTAMAGTQVIMPAFTVEAWFEAMERERCTATALVPTMVNRILSHPLIETCDLSRWRHMGYGASPIPASVLERLIAKFPTLQLNQFYGQTEACGGLATLTPMDHQLGSTRLASAGRPIFNTALRIVDPDTLAPAAQGDAGEIQARTDGLFSGYLNNDALTAETVTEDGWLRTGDIGRLDRDGYLFVVDRVKDMIVTGGENVSSSEVESALLAHPGVADAAVIGVPDADWGERIHAVVIPNPGERLDEASLKAACRSRIAGYKCPKSFTVRTEPLPLSAMGKIRKDLLRADILDRDALEAGHG